LRIGFFTWEYPPLLVGGLGIYAHYITKRLVELGNDVSVFTLNSIGIKTREILNGVEVHRPMIADASDIFPLFVTEDLRRWGTHIKFFSDMFVYNVLSATKFVNELVKKEQEKYDIICIHDWLSSIAGLIIKKELKIPMVFHVHSTEWGRSGDGGSQVITHLENATAKMADGNITVSYLMKEDLALHGWDESKIHVVWNGVDPERYNPKNVDKETSQNLRKKYNIKEDEQMILFVGRLTWVKGVRNLILALPLILNEFPKTKLVIIGKGEEQHDILELIERLKLNDNVICRFDFVPEDERIIYYAAADVCAFPSVYEPFGIVSLEAMAMKKPVVVGARGIVGFREQIISSGSQQNGIHVNGGHPPDIAWGIKEVLRDNERAKKWGENGRDRVLKYFTWELAAKQTINIYENLID